MRANWRALLLGSILAGCSGTSERQIPNETDGGTTPGRAGSSSLEPNEPDSGTVDADAASWPTGDAGNATGSFRVLQPPAICTQPVGSCLARGTWAWQTLLRGDDISPDARIVAGGGQAILVRQNDKSFRIAWLHDPRKPATTGAPPYAVWDAPASDLVPTAITSAKWSDHSEQGAALTIEAVAVLYCDDAHTRCSVWRTDVEANEPVAWSELPMPVDLLANGIAMDVLSDRLEICVYGSGMLCFNDRWHPAIAPSPELRLNAVALGGARSLAVGDQGRWFTRESDGGGMWTEQLPFGSASLMHIGFERISGTAIVVGDGRVQAILSDSILPLECGAPGDLRAVMLTPGYPQSAYAVTTSGEVLQYAKAGPRRIEPYCMYQQLALEGPILQVYESPCQNSINPRIVTDGAVIGTSACVQAF